MSFPISRSEPFPLTTFLDVVERAVVATLFGFFVYRLLGAFIAERNPAYLTIVVSEGLVVLFILIRRDATAFTLRPFDWAIALGGTA